MGGGGGGGGMSLENVIRLPTSVQYSNCTLTPRLFLMCMTLNVANGIMKSCSCEGNENTRVHLVVHYIERML